MDRAEPMTAVDHAELKRLAEGATPGPWTTCVRMGGDAIVDAPSRPVARIDYRRDEASRYAEAAFIAAANPAVVLALLSEIEGLKAERDTARAGRSIIAGGSMDMAVMYASANERADAAEDALRTQAPDSWRPDREAVARVIDPSSWSVMDGYLAQMKRKYRGENIGYDAEQFQHQESLAKADAILALRPQTAESGK